MSWRAARASSPKNSEMPMILSIIYTFPPNIWVAPILLTSLCPRDVDSEAETEKFWRVLLDLGIYIDFGVGIYLNSFAFITGVDSF